jgi:hypothetical protein
MSSDAKGPGGYWTGEYAYPEGQFSTTPFNAHLIEDGSSLSGTITEADHNGFFKPVIVLSVLNGSVDGANISFIKRMQNAGPHQRHAIHYSGVLNAEGTEIRGRWIISGDWSGDFQMTRGDLGEEEMIQLVAEVDA